MTLSERIKGVKESKQRIKGVKRIKGVRPL
jgi:hypothetical protein